MSNIETRELEAFITAVEQVIMEAEDRQRKTDRTEATRFNVFSLIEPKEDQLSDVLKDLLSPAGAHGQDDRFLQMLYGKLSEVSDTKMLQPIKVEREFPIYIDNHYRFIDILIDEPSRLVGIENKVDAPEGWKQVKEYLEWLKLHAEDRKIPYALIYLTPNGRPPESLTQEEFQAELADHHLTCWSYQKELKEWLESCRKGCEAAKISHFLSDFVAYIETDLMRDEMGQAIA